MRMTTPRTLRSIVSRSPLLLILVKFGGRRLAEPPGTRVSIMSRTTFLQAEERCAEYLLDRLWTSSGMTIFCEEFADSQHGDRRRGRPATRSGDVELPMEPRKRLLADYEVTISPQVYKLFVGFKPSTYIFSQDGFQNRVVWA